MPGPRVPIERAQVRHHLGPEGVQVEVADQLQEVPFRLHHHRHVPVLEEVAHPLVAPVEGSGIAGEERAHGPGQGADPRPHQEVGVVREEGPGVDAEDLGLRQGGEARDEVGPAPVVAEEGPPLDPPHHDMVEGVRRIQAGLAGHRMGSLPQRVPGCNVPYFIRVPYFIFTYVMNTFV